MVHRVEFEKASAELHDLIRTADSETLAALYEFAFGSVLGCYVSEDGDCLEVALLKGCDPEAEIYGGICD